MRRRVVLALVAGAITLVQVAPAAATVIVGDGLHNQYDGCIAKFTAAGLRGLVDQLNKSKNKFEFVRKTYTKTDPNSERNAQDGTGTGAVTKWFPEDNQPYEGDSVAPDMCAGLYHEMAHMVDYDNGTLNRNPCTYTVDGKQRDTKITVAEVNAVRKENEYRASQNPKLPPRTAYGKGTHLPPDGVNCDPTPPYKRPFGGCNISCGTGAGDPHLKTFDNRFYEFQGVGEFVLARASAGDPFEVQARMTALPALRTVSIISALGANVAGERVSFYRVREGLLIHIGGKLADVPVGIDHPLPHGGKVYRSPDKIVQLDWPDGSTLEITPVATGAIRLNLYVSQARAGKVEGMFGNSDGKAVGDLVVRGGAAIAEEPTFEALYRTFGDSWRVAQQQSLFDYVQGQNTDTFTDRTFPDKAITVAELPNRATAEMTCRSAGVNHPRALEHCILDVGLTGEAAFADDAATTQNQLKLADAQALTVTAPGGQARHTFAATAGQKVYIEIPASTAPDECSSVQLLDPSDAVLGIGCIINGVGYIDRVVLAKTGTHTVLFKPSRPSQARISVHTATDQALPLTIGQPATSTVGQPGAITTFTYTASANQRVYLDVRSSTLPDQCSVLSLRDASSTVLNTGCVINGRGHVDGTLLVASGQYTITIDPGQEAVGVTQLRLIPSTDQSGAIGVGGPAVTVTITAPGGVGRYAFTGSAGQKVQLEIPASTLPDQCGVIQLRNAADFTIALGCVIGGKGSIATTTLPVSGQYFIVVDPLQAGVGTIQMVLK